MKKIKFKELKEVVNNFHEKNVMLKIKGIINTNVNIKKAYILIIKNQFIIRINKEMNISVDTNWVANFYTNEDSTKIKLEFDNLGEVVLTVK